MSWAPWARYIKASRSCDAGETPGENHDIEQGSGNYPEPNRVIEGTEETARRIEPIAVA
ncbi:MAG: hypothetical protein GY745_07660 [Actinomycetia bacterium]|nr:hypothetical protein [Actinomycetes bacterium]